MTKRVTLPMENYNGDLCGMRFDKSVAVVDDDGSLRMQRLVHRLTTLFPATVVEEVAPAPAPAPAPVMFMDEAEIGEAEPVEEKPKPKGKRR